MTDAHCHIVRSEAPHFVCNAAGPLPAPHVFFFGTHPWYLDGFDARSLRDQLKAYPAAGVGEIGLDRLRSRDISARMREVFAAQLDLAAEFRRPVVLHGAKCWGEVVKACMPYAGRIPAFLFHGFSRSAGLLPQIAAVNGFVSVGPAILNDHAVNYRALAKAVPAKMLLVESDATEENAAETATVDEVAAKLAEIRSVPIEELTAVLEANAQNYGILHND